MPHIQLPPELPGITGAFAFRPETAKPMRELADRYVDGLATWTPTEPPLSAMGERFAHQGYVPQPGRPQQTEHCAYRVVRDARTQERAGR